MQYMHKHNHNPIVGNWWWDSWDKFNTRNNHKCVRGFILTMRIPQSICAFTFEGLTFFVYSLKII